MAAITLALIASGDLTKFEVPLWVVILSAVTIAFGTYAGGWRIIRTLGWSILKLEPATGMAAQLTGATVIQVATFFGLPVSTTHVLSSGVAGTMAANGSGLQLATVRNIAMAWVLTLPSAMIISGGLYWVFTQLF